MPENQLHGVIRPNFVCFRLFWESGLGGLGLEGSRICRVWGFLASGSRGFRRVLESCYTLNPEKVVCAQQGGLVAACGERPVTLC